MSDYGTCVILIVCEDPMSCLLRWIGGLQYSAVGFIYSSSISSTPRLTLFNVYDVKTPSYLNDVKTVDELLSHPLVSRVYTHALTLDEGGIVRFKLSMSSILTQGDDTKQLEFYVNACLDRSVSFRSVPSINHVLATANQDLLRAFYHNLHIKGLSILNIPVKGDMTKAHQEALVKQRYEMNKVSSMITSSFDVYKSTSRLDRKGVKQGIADIGDLLHSIVQQHNSTDVLQIPLSLMVSRYNHVAGLTGLALIPELLTNSRLASVITDPEPVMKVSVPFIKRIVTTSKYDLDNLTREELSHLLTYINDLTELDSRFIDLQADVVRRLA